MSVQRMTIARSGGLGIVGNAALLQAAPDKAADEAEGGQT
jgi:hypothetical protein